MIKKDLNVLLKTHTNQYQCVVFDYATLPRPLERAEYKINRSIAIAVCIERLLKSGGTSYNVEYSYKDVHIFISAESTEINKIHIEVYDCYHEVQPNFESVDDFQDICFSYMTNVESHLNGNKPFALSFILNGQNYGIITKLKDKVVYELAEPLLYNATDEDFWLNERYLDCIDTGVGGVDYIINLKKLFL